MPDGQDVVELKHRGLEQVHKDIKNAVGHDLKAWVAVATWDDGSGKEKTTILGTGAPLALRGYLLDGVYASAHLAEEEFQTLEAQSMDEADEVRRFEGGRMELVSVGGSTIGRGIFEPGWRWSEAIKPLVGTESCENSHFGYVISGSMMIRMDDGEEYQVSQGDALHIAPGHDAWTVGDEACVILEVRSAEQYAQPQ